MNNLHVLNLSAYTSPVVSETNRENWVDFLTEDGDQYFQFLIERYSNSTTNNAIINNVARLIYGKGLSALDANKKPNEYAQMMSLFHKEDVEVYLSDKTLIGTTITVSPPVYIDVIASIQYTKLDQYTNAEIELGIKNKVLTDFGYTGVFFEDTIYPQDIEFSLQQVPGIKVAKVTQLYRDGESPASTTLEGDPDELFRFTEANLNITEI